MYVNISFGFVYELLMKNKWLKALSVYNDRRMLIMLGLGFSSGFPLLLVFGTLNLWLDASGISYALIGAFSLVKTPYSFKWMWSPIVDRVRLPFFERFGRRRGWALFTQLIMMFSIWGMSTISPAEHTCWLAAMAVFVTIASASQDIVLDAFRIESFRDNEQGAGAAIFVLGYRLGMLFSGAVALWLAAYMSWNQVYFIMGFGALVGIITVLCSKEPVKDRRYKEPELKGNFSQRVKRFIDKAVIEPFADFVKRPNWKLILLFVFLYRMSDAYMGPMANVFYVKMGFSTLEIASISKLFGMAATILGGIVGGIVVNRFGIMKSLWICGVLQGLTTLVFVVQAYAGHNIYVLIGCISLDNISGGMCVSAFVAYMSSLCNVAYTATQYALLSSLMSFARDVCAATSGLVAALVSWDVFFMITSLMVLPGLFVLYILQSREGELSAKVRLK